MKETFNLIKSLSKAEKRYFVRFSNFQTPEKENQYLALFNAINKQNEYNKEELLIKFGEKHFAQLKQRLHFKLMQALRMFHSKELPQNTIIEQQQNCRILLDKGMWNQAKKELTKAINSANKNERHLELLSLYSNESYLHSIGGNTENIKSQLKNIDDNFELQIEKVTNLWEYEKIYLKITILNDELEAVRNKKELNIVNNFLELPQLSIQDYPQTLLAQLIQFYAKGIAYYLKGNINNCGIEMEKALEIIQVNNSLLKNREELFIRLYANLILVKIRLNLLNEAKLHLNKFKTQNLNSNSLRKNKDYLIYILELMLYNKQFLYEKAVEHIKEKQTWLNSYQSQIENENIKPQERIYNVFQTATTYLGINDYKKASNILLDFITNSHKGLKKDAYSMVRIFYLVILIERNNEALLNSELKSVMRYLKSKTIIYRFEKIFLRFISKMLIATSQKKIKSLYSSLSIELETLQENNFEKNAFVYFDFLNWAKSKY